MLKTKMWKAMIAFMLVNAIVFTIGSIATAAPQKKIIIEPMIQVVDVNLVDLHFYHTMTGTLRVENPVEYQIPGVVLRVNDTEKEINVPANYKETRNGKMTYTFYYIVTDKRDVAKGIRAQAAFLKKDGTVERLAEQAELTVGAGVTDVALGIADIDVVKEIFDWNANVAIAKIVTKRTTLRTMQVLYKANDANTWKTVPAIKIGITNGLAEWRVTMPVSTVTTQIKIAVAYKWNGKTMVDRTNQDAWTWIRE